MKVNEDVARCNAKSQQGQKDSVYHYWRRALALRKELRDTLVYGTFEMHDGQNEAIMSYSRHCEATNAHALVILNFTDEDQQWVVPSHERAFLVGEKGHVALSSYETANPAVAVVEEGQALVSLRPFEAVVFAGTKAT